MADVSSIHLAWQKFLFLLGFGWEETEVKELDVPTWIGVDFTHPNHVVINRARDHPFVSYHVEYRMTDEFPEPQDEPSEPDVPKVVVHCRMRQADRGFSWTFEGPEAVQKAKEMAEWARQNPNEWVSVTSQEEENWYPLREIMRIEIRGLDGTIVNDVDDDSSDAEEISEEEQVKRFREQMDRELGGGSPEE